MMDVDFPLRRLWLTERGWVLEPHYPDEGAEMALAHAAGDKVEAACRRSDFIGNDFAALCHDGGEGPIGNRQRNRASRPDLQHG